jgi:cAMP-dependent protein kinase regulator
MAEQHAADVQAELQDYLNKKNVNQLFIQIVENLLIEKPDNPIRFIIEYLEKRFPDQARPAPKPAAR